MEGDPILLEEWPIRIYAIPAGSGWSWRGYTAIELRSGDRTKSADSNWQTAPTWSSPGVAGPAYPVVSRIYLHEGDEASPLTYSIACLDDGSHVSMQQARWWFESCKLRHGHSYAEPPPLPSRVIDVHHSLPQPRLKVQAQLPVAAEYATLSYCWGKTKATITTVINVREHIYHGFDYVSLPKTIQDAISVTHELGLRYLWVDALCILQGSDPEACRDWDIESSRMASIYGNATVTIIAASSSDCGQGIFRKRSIVRTAKIALDGFTNRKVWSAHRQLTTDLGLSAKYNTRGWTLQEMMLSPRALFFTPSMRYWKCPHGVVGEDCKQSRFTAVKSLTSNHAQQDWHAVVQEYSRRKLTNEKDKFPALSGLASIYHQYHSSAYHAGLWQASIHRDLLWRTELSETPMPPVNVWRAPSWSWASTNEAIDFDLANGDINEADYMAEVVPNVKIDSVDIFGRLKDAKLQVRGKVKEMHRLTVNAYHTAGDAVTDGLTVRAYVDSKKKWDDAETISEPCQLLLLTRTRGLVITQVSSPQRVFRRIGVFMVTPRFGSNDVTSWKDAEITLL